MPPQGQASQTAVLRQASIESFSELPRLPDSRSEAMAIERIAGVSNTHLFFDFDASPQRVEASDWRPYAVAHFAAHAIVEPANHVAPEQRSSTDRRVEAFNLFNWEQFGVPNGQLGTSTLGWITAQANSPRILQIAGRFSF
jgi:CHAT domain-containing protein